MSFRLAIVDAYVRSTLECGEPPHSKVLRTAIFMRAAVSDTAVEPREIDRLRHKKCRNSRERLRLSVAGEHQPLPQRRLPR
jgi:hypothetical protein